MAEPLTPRELEEAIKHVTAYDSAQVGMLEYSQLWRLIVAARQYVWMLRRTEELIDQAAAIFERRAAIHAVQAKWMGPQRQYYEGPRPVGIEAHPMNGPAISFDREMANAAEVRALQAAGEEVEGG